MALLLAACIAELPYDGNFPDSYNPAVMFCVIGVFAFAIIGWWEK